MHTLSKWISHRARMLGFADLEALAALAAMPAETLRYIDAGGTLNGISRSSRASLARALRVSLRELERLACGRTPWIGDGSLLSADYSAALRPPIRADNAFPLIKCARSIGMPILGRLLESGRVEHFAFWSSDDGARLPMRIRATPDAFALQLDRFATQYNLSQQTATGDYPIFHPIRPEELQIGDQALITLDGPGDDTRLTTIGDEGKTQAADGIVRAAVLVAWAGADMLAEAPDVEAPGHQCAITA